MSAHPISARARGALRASGAARARRALHAARRRAAALATCCLVLAGGPIAARAQSAAVPDTLAQRLAACTPCHGKEGRSIGGTYYPRIAGKPEGYLFNQLQNFRDGRRHDAAMAWLVRHLPDAYLREIAAHFAAQHPPYPPPAPVGASAAALERGRRLVTGGDPAKKVPACTACHGAALTGIAPAVPGLLGLPRDYLNAQFGAWRNGQRSAHAPDCMAEIAKRLDADDVSAATAWLASQPVPASDLPAPMPPAGLPMRCGGIDGGPSPGATPATGAAQAARDVQAAGDVRDVRDARVAPAERGRVLALAGNCAGCHTARGGAPYAGGRGIETPFGTVYATNITPDPDTGIGRWSADDFRRAMHEGRSRDGSALYPVFPYTSYTRVTREDADAIFAYLRTLAPVRAANRPHALRFPYNLRPLLALWRALYFSPGEFRPDPARGPQWNRGAYLVQGLGHCGACHTDRNVLGASRSGADLAGGQLAASGWYSPSLTSPAEAGVGHWPLDEVVALLRTGSTRRATASGPMASVVYDSLQHLPQEDLRAIAVYLASLSAPATPATPATTASPAPGAPPPAGARLYERHCESCHGRDGAGAPPAYPALAANRAVTLPDPSNAIRAVLLGGFAPGTAGNPRPWGMPPFSHTLGDAEVAAVLTYVRGAWGNRAAAVSSAEVNRLRAAPR